MGITGASHNEAFLEEGGPLFIGRALYFSDLFIVGNGYD